MVGIASVSASARRSTAQGKFVLTTRSATIAPATPNEAHDWPEPGQSWPCATASAMNVWSKVSTLAKSRTRSEDRKTACKLAPFRLKRMSVDFVPPMSPARIIYVASDILQAECLPGLLFLMVSQIKIQGQAHGHSFVSLPSEAERVLCQVHRLAGSSACIMASPFRYLLLFNQPQGES